MKSYLKLIAIFLIPLFIFFLFIEIVERQIPNDYKEKSSYLEQNSNKIEVLILGSSHSLSFIQPKLFQSETFNAAHLHQTLKFDRYIFDRYIKNMTQLKVVIVPISYGSFFSSLENSKDNWRVKDYKLYYGYKNSQALFNRLEITNGNTALQFKECFDFLTKGIDKRTCTDKGYGIKFSQDPQTDLKKTGLIVANRHTKDCNIEYTKENTESLEYILSESEKHNIRVFLYTAPAWHTYRENLNQEFLSETIKITKEIINRYSNVIYINYLDDPRFLKEHFRDVDHLNERGSTLFTEIIKKEIGVQ